jgi:hypothetical protein
MKETVLDSHLSLFEMLYLQQIREQLLYSVLCGKHYSGNALCEYVSAAEGARSYRRQILSYVPNLFFSYLYIQLLIYTYSYISAWVTISNSVSSSLQLYERNRRHISWD